MNITREQLAELAQKAKKVATTKYLYEEREYTGTKIYEDGSIATIMCVGSMGYYEDESCDIELEDLDKSEEQLKKEGQEYRARMKQQADAARAAQEASAKLLEEQRERAEFERLSKKFGK